MPAPPGPAPVRLSNPDATIQPYGDAGVLLRLHAAAYEQRWAQAQALARRLEQHPIAGLVDVVATYQDVFVSFDPLRCDPADFAERVGRAASMSVADPPSGQPRRTFEVPVAYGGVHGPDLGSVAAELGLSPSEVIARHAAQVWTIRFRAAPVAAPFLDGIRWPAPIARMEVPRTRLPVGSVALSGQQCVIYPVAAPGGWRIIARTPRVLIDVQRPGLSRYRAGDRVSFVPVSETEFDSLRARPAELDGTD